MVLAKLESGFFFPSLLYHVFTGFSKALRVWPVIEIGQSFTDFKIHFFFFHIVTSLKLTDTLKTVIDYSCFNNVFFIGGTHNHVRFHN